MKLLIGDIGNTVTKISLIETNKYKNIKNFYFDSIKILNKNLLKKYFKIIKKKKNINKYALFSSVVPKYKSKLKKYLIKNHNIKLIEINEKKIKKNIFINIKNKRQVGSDRLANAVSVYNKYKINCIVVDFGTATTFDVVTKKGVYNGGVISPGISLSIKNLFYSADQIPFFKLKIQKKIIGKNTLEALRSGFYWGYIGLIKNIIERIEKETNNKYKIIFTGGYANIFQKSLSRPVTVDKNITINGVIEIFKQNKKYLIK
tara:strand:+ start:1158 stop:1937 length:780 start_codon:yes stop_codon:yes gene_type:complete